MRITNRAMIESTIQSMEMNRERLNDLQTKAASGKDFQRASEDPLRAATSMNLRSSLNKSQAYTDTANSASDWLSATETTLDQMVDLGMKAHNLALGAITDSHGDADRTVIAEELTTLIEETLNKANSTHKNDYLFSGYKTSTVPFVRDPGPPETIAYQGDNGIMTPTISPNQGVEINVNGNDLTGFLNAMIAARDAILTNDSAQITAATDNLQQNLAGVSEQRSLTGMRQRQLQGTLTQLDEVQQSMKNMLSDAEDASMVDVITQLRFQEIVYQSALEVGNRTIGTANLFDYLS